MIIAPVNVINDDVFEANGKAIRLVNEKINGYLEDAMRLSERGADKEAFRKYNVAKNTIFDNLTAKVKQNMRNIEKRIKVGRPQTAYGRLERKTKMNHNRILSNVDKSTDGPEEQVPSINIKTFLKKKNLGRLKCKYLPVRDDGMVSSYLKDLKRQQFPCDEMHSRFLQGEMQKMIREWQKNLQLKSALAEEAIAAFEMVNNDSYEKAERMLLKTLNIQQNLLKVNNHEMIARTLHNIGCFYASTHKFKEAESYFTRALQMRKRIFTNSQIPYSPNAARPDNIEVYHIDIAESLNDLGCVRLSLNLPTALCEKDLTRALQMREFLLHPLHPLITESYFNLSISNLKGGRRVEALKFMRKCLQLRKRNRDNAGVIKCSIALADIYSRDLHLYRQALDLLLSAVTLQQDFFSDAVVEAEIFHRVCRLHFSHQKYTLAKEYGHRAIEKIQTVNTQRSRAYEVIIKNDVSLVVRRLETKRLYQEKLDLEKRMREGRSSERKKRMKKKKRKKGSIIKKKKKLRPISAHPRLKGTSTPKSQSKRRRRPQTSNPRKRSMENKDFKNRVNKSIESLGSALPSGTLSDFTISTNLSSLSLSQKKRKKCREGKNNRKTREKAHIRDMEIARRRYRNAEKARLENEKERNCNETKEKSSLVNKRKYLIQKSKHHEIGNLVWISSPTSIVKPPGYVKSDTSFILRQSYKPNELVQW
eukprot:g4966.t1